jgi:hypothetical protein
MIAMTPSILVVEDEYLVAAGWKASFRRSAAK